MLSYKPCQKDAFIEKKTEMLLLIFLTTMK